jgi:hypothetical protein
MAGTRSSVHVSRHSKTTPSGPVISLENLLFDFPEADVFLRSRDSYEFRVLKLYIKLYIAHNSAILGEKILLSPNPQPQPSDFASPVDLDVEKTAANALRVVQLPVEGAVLFSLLTYIFPAPPILPSTTEKIMELLSVAQMYKMDVVLTHIRNHIAQQEPPLIREETALLVYSLSQKHGLRIEALQAARCTLSFPGLTIEDLAKKGKLDMMSGAFLHELWKYHERVRLNLTSDLEEFKKSNALAILGDLKCNNPIGSGGPFWLDSYISNIGMGPVAAALDFTDFHMGLTKHITYWSSNVTKTRSGCAACSGVPRKKLCELWEALTATVHCGIAKVSVIYVQVAASPNGPEHFYRLR